MSNLAAQQNSQILQFTQSGDLLRNVMDHAAVGMALVSVAGQLIYANPAFCEILGYEQDDLADLTPSDLSPADPLSGAHIDFARLRSGKIDNMRGECQYRRKDGALTWVLLSASILRGERTSNPAHLIVQITDIDKQKQAEAALTYSENRWNNALEAGGQGVWDHDIRSDRMFYSAKWRTIRGYEPDEDVHYSQEEWLSRLHPEDRERIRDACNRQDRGEAGYDVLEYREKHKDGHYVWIHSRGRPIEWASDGTPIRTVGTDTDITLRKEMEARIAEEEERLRVTLNSIAEGVISTDAQGRVTFLNPSAQKMTGWSKSAAVGKHVSEVFETRVDNDTARRADLVSKCLRSQQIETLPGYTRFTNKDGQEFFVRETVSPVKNQDDKLLGAVIVFQDATNRRDLMLKLEHSATHDLLTGLPNRRVFEERLENAIEDASCVGDHHALCLIDLDHFKAVNDGAGHAAGDALLQGIGQLIKECCREDDCVSRIGGDEFAVVLNNCTLRSARETAETIVSRIKAFDFRWQDHDFKIGASLGVAAIDAHSGSAIEIYKLADAACYTAKRKGRGCVVVGH